MIRKSERVKLMLWREKESIYSGEFVAGVANEHAGFAYSSVSNCDALDESWSCWSHCCKQQEENLKDNLLTEKKIDRNNEMGVLFCFILFC